MDNNFVGLDGSPDSGGACTRHLSGAESRLRSTARHAAPVDLHLNLAHKSNKWTTDLEINRDMSAGEVAGRKGEVEANADSP